MNTTSADGTTIAYSVTGTGPAVIVVDGISCYRELGPSAKLAAELAAHGHRAITYDRRGRGESGHGPSAGEIADIAALLEVAGGEAVLLGISSGAVLALDAAAALPGVTRVVGFEAPVMPGGDEDVVAIERHLAADDRGAAVAHFLRSVGMPRPLLAIMRLTPPWRKLKATAPTMPNDLRLVSAAKRELDTRWSALDIPVTILDGGKSPADMRAAQDRVAAGIPTARRRTLPGQTHLVKAKVLVPAFLDEEEDHGEYGVDRQQLQALEPR